MTPMFLFLWHSSPACPCHTVTRCSVNTFPLNPFGLSVATRCYVPLLLPHHHNIQSFAQRNHNANTPIRIQLSTRAVLLDQRPPSGFNCFCVFAHVCPQAQSHPYTLTIQQHLLSYPPVSLQQALIVLSSRWINAPQSQSAPFLCWHYSWGPNDRT